MTPLRAIQMCGGFIVLLGCIVLPGVAYPQTHDYQDYRDAGYFDDGFYDDDWFYDWYDTGFSETTEQRDYSHYYEKGSAGQLFEASRTRDPRDREQRRYKDEESGLDPDAFERETGRRRERALLGERDDRRETSRSPSSTITGEVDRGKKVRILGTDADHLVVLLQSRGGRRAIVDLGPVSDLRGLHVRSGDWISAQGAFGRIGQRRVLMAHRFMTDDGEVVRIDRHRQRMAGRIEHIATAKVKGTDKENLLVRVKTPEGRRVVVDLGTAENLNDLEMARGARVSVRGPIVRVHDTPVVMAKQIRIEDEVKQVTRVNPSRTAGGATSTAVNSGGRKPLRDAIHSARQAVRAADDGQPERMVKQAERALIQANNAPGNERVNEAMAALRDAIKHGQKGHVEDAREHLQHAIMRLSQEAGTQLPEDLTTGSGEQPRQEAATEAKPLIGQALRYAKEAQQAARDKQADALLRHAEQAITKGKQAQRFGHNERLNEGLYELGDAMEHAKHGDLNDVEAHLQRAVIKLSQAGGAQAEKAAQQNGGTEAKTITGEVLVKGEVLAIDRDGFYVVRDQSGREVRMIVSEGLHPNIRVGDAISAEVQGDGRVLSIQRDTESRR